MASQDKIDVFNERKHRKVGDIVVIGGDVNIYKVTSTFPLDLENLTEYPETKPRGKMFNLTHFMINFKEYIRLISTPNPFDPWGYAAYKNYEGYILEFIKLIYSTFPEGAYTFSEFLIFIDKISHYFDKSKMPQIKFEQMKIYFNELENTDLYKSIMQSTLGDAPQFKKHKLPKKTSKKSPKKSPKKTPKKSPKKSSKKTPKKA